jgi:hypothetical protein
MKRWFVYASIVAAVALFALPASAGKGKGGGGKDTPATIRLDQADPRLYDWVTFSLSYERSGPDRVTNPYVLVHCHQTVDQGASGELVWQSVGPEEATYKLGGAWSSSFWSLNDGPAYCVAELWSIEDQGGSARQIASTTFQAGRSR